LRFAHVIAVRSMNISQQDEYGGRYTAIDDVSFFSNFHRI